MKDILQYHVATHPSMTARDAIKLCYQATFGAEHLLTDITRAKAYFDREWQQTPAADTPVAEPLSENYVRIALGAWKHFGLPPQWLFKMFFDTASTPSGASTEELTTKLNEVAALAADGEMPFSAALWQDACNEYLQNGGGAVHHSESYRAAEKPVYRVVSRRYTDLIPLLLRLSAIRPQTDRATVIAIDGRAASGKSTLAQMLAGILDAGVIHMDDFFLPPELRTSERLAVPGGNVHYERFTEQVMPHLGHNGAFDYPVFNCAKMQLDGVREVIAGKWRIVEGSYSHHPKLGNYMDIRVFCTVSPEEQMRRILHRNGERMAKMFSERWIPMEETYFQAFDIAKQPDILIQTESKGAL